MYFTRMIKLLRSLLFGLATLVIGTGSFIVFSGEPMFAEDGSGSCDCATASDCPLKSSSCGACNPSGFGKCT